MTLEDRPKPEELLKIAERERNAALWVYENGKEAGWSTTTLPKVRKLYLPLKGLSETVGVVIFRPQILRIFTIDEKNTLYAADQEEGLRVYF